MNEPLSLQTIEEVEALQALEPEWQALYRRCAVATPFQAPAWLIAWWHAFAPGRLKTLAVRRRGRLVGVAPLYADSDRLLPLGIALSDLVDVLVDPEEFASVLPFLARALSACTAWRYCEWPELRPEAAVWRLPVPAGVQEERAPSSTCPVLPIAASAQCLRDILPAHRMQSLRTASRRARQSGDVRITSATAATIEQSIRLLHELHSARWNSSGMPGVTADPRVVRALQLALPPLIERGEALMYCLELSGRCIAAHLLFQSRSSTYSYLSGFAVEARALGPGTLLLGHAIEQALLHGRREFDFLRGEEHYKYLWGALPRRNAARRFKRV